MTSEIKSQNTCGASYKDQSQIEQAKARGIHLGEQTAIFEDSLQNRYDA
jgi:hypothetical protein